jgi:photosystem II stability/assembly factor-like uncharacterized protein
LVLLALALFLSPATKAHAQWEIEESHTTASLRGIHNVGGGVAWASGTNGTVLRTEDGGYLWQTCAIPLAGTKDSAEKLDFRGIQAFDANTAIVMSSGPGDQSRLYKTTDGCQTWKLVFTNPDKDGFWDAIQFRDKTYGELLGDPVRGAFFLAETSDGGGHWVEQHNSGLKADPKMQGAFAASNSSLTADNGHIIFASGGAGGAYVRELSEIAICVDGCSPAEMNLDGHENKWSLERVPVGASSEASGIFSLGKKGLVVVGGDYLNPNDAVNTAAYYIDGGKTWHPAQTPPHGYRSAVAYDEKTKTWITVGPNGTDISTDDGRNWRPLTPSPQDAPDADKNWNALSLPFVVGPNGRIGKLRGNALPSATSTIAKPAKLQ